MLCAIVTDEASRVLAAAVAMWSAFDAFGLAIRAHRVFRAHAGFVALWSLVAAWGMFGLSSFPVPPLPVEVLNVAWCCTLGGWLTLWRRKVPAL